MTENLYTPGCIRTVSGQYVNIADPDPETIRIEDIAHALSQLPRFGGHLPRFYSVAQHCMACAELVAPEHKLQALLHDASEAYLLDVPSPLKALLPEYQKLEARFMELIAKKFGFGWPLAEEVKGADRAMLEQEWHHVMLKGPRPEGTFVMSSKYACMGFMNAFREYQNTEVTTK